MTSVDKANAVPTSLVVYFTSVTIAPPLRSHASFSLQTSFYCVKKVLSKTTRVHFVLQLALVSVKQETLHFMA